jgi:RNA polymerase sigma factor (sigma-70 family)
LHAVFGTGTCAGLSDGQLLERFTGRNGEAAELAFAVLVERHGPMVFRVCRGILRDPHDAQDAFQATFLVLVRRAGSVRNRDSVGSWLHGVALRVAACALSASARRRRHERRAGERSREVLREDERGDLKRAVHEEVGRLPERLRVPIVLCYLEGMTQDEAAARLGWPIGTVRSRLARARDRLRARLARRGLAPAAGALTAALSADAAGAAVPPALMEGTVRLAARLATARAIPSSVAALAGGALRSMLMNKLGTTVVSLLVVVAITAGAGVLGQQGDANGSARALSELVDPPAQGPPGAPGDAGAVEGGDLVRRLTQQAADQRVALEKTEKELRRAKAQSPPRVPSRAAAPEQVPPGEDPPSDEEIWKQLIAARFKNVRFDVEGTKSTVSPCKIYPLAGPCQLVRSLYKCTVGFDEVEEGDVRHRTQVVYVEKDHLRRCADPGHNHVVSSPLSEEIRRAEERLDWSEKMLNKGYVSKSQHEADRARLDALWRRALQGDGPAPSNAADQERRLKDVERKLDQILKALEGTKRDPVAPGPSGAGRGLQ